MSGFEIKGLVVNTKILKNKIPLITGLDGATTYQVVEEGKSI